MRDSSEAERLAHNQDVGGSSPSPASKPRPWWWGPTRDERLEARAKANMVRDYSRGSLRDHISRADTMEELEAIAAFLEKLVDEGKIRLGAAMKISKAGERKARELSERRVELVPRPRLLVPGKKGEIHTDSGLVLIKP